MDDAAGNFRGSPEMPATQRADDDRSLASIPQQLWVYVGMPVLVLGTVQHMLTLLVLLGSRRMRSLPLSVYLAASALSGLAALYIGLLRQILLNLDGFKRDVREETTDAGCRLHAALTYLSLQLFAWLQACVAVERVVAVRHPLQYKQWCTWKRNLVIVLVMILTLASLNTIVVDSYSLDDANRCAPYKEFLFDSVWGSVDLVLFSLMPVAVMVPCNISTVVSICRSGEYRRGKNASASYRRSRQLTLMLLVSNIICILTTLPISIIFLAPGWSRIPGSIESITRLMEWTVFSLLQYLGTTLDFTIYSLLAQKFRQATRDLFCNGLYGRVTSQDSTSHLSLHSIRAFISSSKREWELESIVHGSVEDMCKNLPKAVESSRDRLEITM